METVAVITDIHGNLPALEAALARVDELAPDAHTFERIAAGSNCDVLVFGHTHKPWIATYLDVLFVNCGSVGKPKDGDPRGAFAVLEASPGGVEARIERFEYDAELASREVAAAGLPGEFAEKLLVAA